MTSDEVLNLTHKIYSILKKIELHQSNLNQMRSFVDLKKSQTTQFSEDQLKIIQKLENDLKNMENMLQEYDNEIKTFCEVNNCFHLLEVAKTLLQFPL